MADVMPARWRARPQPSSGGDSACAGQMAGSLALLAAQNETFEEQGWISMCRPGHCSHINLGKRGRRPEGGPDRGAKRGERGPLGHSTLEGGGDLHGLLFVPAAAYGQRIRTPSLDRLGGDHGEIIMRFLADLSPSILWMIAAAWLLLLVAVVAVQVASARSTFDGLATLLPRGDEDADFEERDDRSESA